MVPTYTVRQTVEHYDKSGKKVNLTYPKFLIKWITLAYLLKEWTERSYGAA